MDTVGYGMFTFCSVFICFLLKEEKSVGQITRSGRLYTVEVTSAASVLSR